MTIYCSAIYRKHYPHALPIKNNNCFILAESINTPKIINGDTP